VILSRPLPLALLLALQTRDTSDPNGILRYETISKDVPRRVPMSGYCGFIPVSLSLSLAFPHTRARAVALSCV
jgi:hypothetical protein